MARQVTLGIKIQVNGQEKVIKSINELESEIEQLTQDIKGLDFGSAEFEQASKRLGQLKAGLRDVDKQIEGVDREQLFEGFGAAINGVTGAFLIASSAARTFGVDAETVEEIALREQQALEAVNIALGAQAIAEAFAKREKVLATAARVRDTIATGLNTAAQNLYTAAVGASTGALRAFRIALATTGIGALVVGLGFLISKLFDAKEETEEVNEEFKKLSEFQLEAQQSTIKETQSIETLIAVLDSANTSLETKQEAYEELKKLVPELEGLTYEQADAEGVLADAIERQIELIELRAQARAIEDFLVESEKRRLAAEQERKEAEEFTNEIEKQFELQQEYARAQAGGFAGSLEEYVEQQRAYGRELGITNDETDDAIGLEEELLQIQTKIFELTGRQNRRQKTRNNQSKEENDELQKRNQLLSDLASILSDVNLDYVEQVDVLERANKTLQDQNELLDQRQATIKSEADQTAEFENQLNRLFGGELIPESVPVQIFDAFFAVFKDLEERAEDLDLAPADAQKQFLDYLDTINLKYEDIDGNVKSITSLEQLREQIGDDSLQILFDYFDNQVRIQQSLEESKLLRLAENEEANVLQDLTVKIFEIERDRLKNKQSVQQAEEEIRQTVLGTLFGIENTNDLTEAQKKVVEDTVEALKTQANIYTGTYNTQQQILDLTEEITENVGKQSEALADIGGIESFIKANESRIDEIETFFSQIKAEESQLTQEQIDQINQLIQGIKAKQLTNELSEARQEALALAQEIVAAFSEISGRIASIASTQNSLLLEQLAYSEEVTLARIGDATKEAQEEQEKARQEFARKRFEVEKSSRITELGFSVADAIANGAGAIINTLATVPAPANVALATVIGTIVAAELATIKAQLNFVKSTQYIGRRGGLLSGPSHEMGGIGMGGLQLEGGEAVINRSAVSQFGDILSQISTSTGGRPLVGDDSRIVEEIRRTNQRPIKAYVLDQDIQDTRKINSRLEQISRL